MRTARQSVVINKSTAFSGEPSEYQAAKPIIGETLKPTKELEFPGNDGIYAVRFNPQRDVFTVGFGNGTIKVFGFDENGDEQELYKLTAPSDKSAPILSVRFLPQKDMRAFFATGPLGFIYMSRLRTQTFQCVASEDNQTMAMDINATGDRLVTAGNDLSIRFYDPRTMQIVNVYDCDEMNKDKISGGNYGHTLRIQSAKFHPQHPDMLVTGGWDKMIKVWDRRFAKGLVKTIIGPYLYGDSIDIREKVISTASWVTRGSLQLWDLHSAHLITTLTTSVTPMQPEHLYFGQFCVHQPECPLIFAGGSGAKNIQSIDTSTQDITGMVQFGSSVTCCHTTGNRIIAGSVDGSLKILRIQHPASLTSRTAYLRGALRRRSNASKSKVLEETK